MYILEGQCEFDEREFSEDVAALFDVDVRGSFDSIASFTGYLARLRKETDYNVNNSALSRQISSIEIKFSPGQLLFGIPNILERLVPSLKGKVIVYLLDEAENLTADQQKFVNTLIRYRRGNATIKVGARLYGIRTFETLGSGEPIKLGSEYQQVVLDGFLRDQNADYEKMLNRLVVKRIQRSHASAGVIPEKELAKFFDQLKTADHWKEATAGLALPFDSSGKERPYFTRLARHLKEGFHAEDALVKQVIDALRMRDYPFLEKTSVFILYKRWPAKQESVLSVAQQIGAEAEAYRVGGRSQSSDYAGTLDYFDSDLLAQLFRDFRRRVPYAGLKTLMRLSQGIPRNFLTILMHTYRRSVFAGEQPFAGGIISVAAQSDGVRDSSAWFWEDAQPDANGSEVREAIEALALLLRTIRFSDRPAECDLCTFSVDFEALSDNSKRVLRLAENWSYLIQIREGAKNKNDRGVSAKYQLGPMLAPAWDLSESRRGTIELRIELANALFDREQREELVPLIKARVSGMMAPSFSSDRKSSQAELFV